MLLSTAKTSDAAVDSTVIKLNLTLVSYYKKLKSLSPSRRQCWSQKSYDNNLHSVHCLQLSVNLLDVFWWEGWMCVCVDFFYCEAFWFSGMEFLLLCFVFFFQINLK